MKNPPALSCYTGSLRLGSPQETPAAGNIKTPRISNGVFVIVQAL
jgi:hypothetical protein